MKVKSGYVACMRYVAAAAREQYDKYIGFGVDYVCVDASPDGHSAMVIMRGVAGRFELEFDSAKEASDYYLCAFVVPA